jgi:exosortase
MTTLAYRLAVAVPRSRRRFGGARLSLVAPVLIALGFVPLVVIQARSLWDRPHLQAFPLAVLGGIVLARLATRRLGLLVPGATDRSMTAVLLCGATLALAAFSSWAWLGMLAAMLALLVAAYGLGGGRLMCAVLPAWVFVALAVLPPNSVEVRLVTHLQSWVTAWASPVLNMLGVLHVTEGNVIKIPGRVLLVEQACSGVRSLLFVLGGTLFYVLRTGKTPFRAGVLLAAGAFWVLLGNTARITIVAYVMARWGFDWSTGPRHEALGLLILAAVLGLTVSTDQLFRFLTALAKVPWIQPLIREPRSLDSEGAAESQVAEPTSYPDVRATWLGSRRVASAFGVIGLAQVVWLWPQLADALTPDRIVERLQVLKEDDLPDHCGAARRDSFEIKERETGSDFGNFSRSWRYRLANRVVVVSVDYPFRGWHELTNCYGSVGWTLQQRVIRAGESGTFVTAALQQPEGRLGTLLFGLDDLDGAPLEPRSMGSPLAYLRNRLAILGTPPEQLGRRLATRYEAMPRGYQIQLLIESDTPLSETEQIEARAFFDKVRRTIRQKVAGQSGGAL